MTGSEEGNDASELSDNVGERAGQLLAEITSRRSGAGGRAKAIGLGKEAILAVFKFGMGLSGDQVAEQLGVRGKERVSAVKRTLGGLTSKYLDVQQTPEGKVYSLKGAWSPVAKRKSTARRRKGS